MHIGKCYQKARQQPASAVIVVREKTQL